MKNIKMPSASRQQEVYQELLVGTLLYVVVLGFFNDYTNIVEAKSFSIVFFAAIVLEILTFLTIQLKNMIVKNHKAKRESVQWPLLIFSVWLIMFFSKFVFLAVLDTTLGSYIAINGFFGILLVAATATASHRLSVSAYTALGKSLNK